MSNKPITMQKMRQIIPLHCQGTGFRTIYGMLSISRNTIKKYIAVFHTLRLTYDEFSSKSDAELSTLRYQIKKQSMVTVIKNGYVRFGTF